MNPCYDARWVGFVRQSHDLDMRERKHEQIVSVICLGLCHLCQPITGRRSSSRVPLASQLMASVLHVYVSLINTPL